MLEQTSPITILLQPALYGAKRIIIMHDVGVVSPTFERNIGRVCRSYTAEVETKCKGRL